MNKFIDILLNDDKPSSADVDSVRKPANYILVFVCLALSALFLFLSDIIGWDPMCSMYTGMLFIICGCQVIINASKNDKTIGTIIIFLFCFLMGGANIFSEFTYIFKYNPLFTDGFNFLILLSIILILLLIVVVAISIFYKLSKRKKEIQKILLVQTLLYYLCVIINTILIIINLIKLGRFY